MHAPPVASLGPDARRAIWGLGVTQIIGYGATYYLLSLLARPIADEFGMSTPAVLGGLSLQLACAALFGPRIGRWQDQAGSRVVMTAGSVIVAVGLVLLGLARGPLSYYFAWFVIGLAAPMMLYSAAFTALTQIAGHQARRSISFLTFIGGLASTLFWPLTAWLLSLMDWRNIAFLYAAMQIVICVPVHWRMLGRENTDGSPRAPGVIVEPGLPSAAQPAAFAFLASMLTINGLIINAWSLLVFPVLGALGFLPSAAVLVGSLIGIAQVVGRVTESIYAGRISAMWTGVVSAVTLPLAFMALSLSQGITGYGVAFAVLYGISNGLLTIARGAIVLAIFGTRGYGERINRITIGQNIAGAIGPVLGGVLLDSTGAAELVTLMLMGSMAALLLMVALRSHCARHGLR
ncbi:MAG TPA: hypothetical protein PLE50_04260 [Rhabdaerophilum sp.]|nr:hypothetical protein [Rhabdaerophilum sp.]